MSAIYIQEPQTHGKVVLHTTKGPVDIELWSREAPCAVRNFVQLVLEGYYDNTIFHRLVKNFTLQGGDPTGTGEGGESVNGKPIPVKTHQRLRFVRRGLVASADGLSQFFITLDRADELQGRHTIFGKVAGNTLFNVLEMANQDVDENERPLFPPKILSAEVVDNPFDDIVPRRTAEEQRKQQELVQRALETQERPKKKPKKNIALLSFVDEMADDEREPQTQNTKIISSHDLLTDDALLSKEEVSLPLPKKMDPAEEAKAKVLNAIRKENDGATSLSDSLLQSESNGDQIDDNKHENGSDSFEQKMRAKVRRKVELAAKEDDRKISSIASTTSSTADIQKELVITTADSVKDEIKTIKNLLKQLPMELPSSKSTSKEPKSMPLWKEEKLKFQAEHKLTTKQDKRREEDKVMMKLAAFQNRLSAARTDATRQPDNVKKDLDESTEIECFLHGVPSCLSCSNDVGSTDVVTDDGWLSHSLKFPKDRSGGRKNDGDDDYVVIDPRERMREITNGGSKGKNEDKKRRSGTSERHDIEPQKRKKETMGSVFKREKH